MIYTIISYSGHQLNVISKFNLFKATDVFADIFISEMLHLIETDSIHFPLTGNYKDDMVKELSNRDTSCPTFTITSLELYFRDNHQVDPLSKVVNE